MSIKEFEIQVIQEITRAMIMDGLRWIGIGGIMKWLYMA